MMILLIEDDEVDQLAFERAIRKTAYEYRIVGTVGEAKTLLASENFDIIVSDYKLPDGTGIDILKMQLPIPVIITTGAGNEEIAVQVLDEGAADYLIKDLNRTYLTILPSVIEKALQQKKTNELLVIFSEAIKNSSDGICVIDKQKKIIFINQAFCEQFNYKKEEILGQNEETLLENIQLKASHEASLESTTTEFTFTHADGSLFFCLITTINIVSKSNQQVATVTVYKDITKHVESERSLRIKAEELAHTRAELEQLELFAFVSTHDLQEPLHKIITFGNLIMGDPEIILSQAAMNYRDKILEAVEELSQMISQLHDYSKILTAGEPFTSVNLNTVVNDVLEKLKPEITRWGVHFQIDKLPNIFGDQRQLYKLFLNLIKNSIVFHREDIPPIIKICSSQTDTSVRISIEDNGIGIDEKYLTKLFKPFQRLHSSSKYPGRGLGLAICKRIMQRHSGEISAKSTLGKGSIFTLTFNKYL